MDRHTEPSSGYLALAFQLRKQLFYETYRYREADADVGSGPRKNGRIHSDDFAAQINQRSSGISRIDGSVCLNETIVGSGPDPSAFGADDAGGDRVGKTKGTAQRDNPFSHLQPIGITERDDGQIFGIDLDHCDIGLGVCCR